MVQVLTLAGVALGDTHALCIGIYRSNSSCEKDQKHLKFPIHKMLLAVQDIRT